MLKEEHIALRQFLLRLLLLLLIVAAVDQGLGAYLRRLYFSQRSGDYFRTTYGMDSTRAPLLVLGSSRASHHFVPAVLDSVLQMPAYNSGRDGCEILNNLAVFRAATQRYQPRLIILELSPKELYNSQESYDKLSNLLPYYRSHPEVRDLVKLRGPYESWKLVSATYPFNSQLIRLFNGRWNLSGDIGIRQGGYLPLQGSGVSGTADNQLPDPPGAPDANKLNALKEMTAYCRQRQIPFLVVYSPIFSNIRNQEGSRVVRSICAADGALFWDYSNDVRFDGHPEFFRDNSHMNDAGARYFSAIIADSIRSAAVAGSQLTAAH